MLSDGPWVPRRKGWNCCWKILGTSTRWCRHMFNSQWWCECKANWGEKTIPYWVCGCHVWCAPGSGAGYEVTANPYLHLCSIWLVSSCSTNFVFRNGYCDWLIAWRPLRSQFYGLKSTWSVAVLTADYVHLIASRFCKSLEELLSTWWVTDFSIDITEACGAVGHCQFRSLIHLSNLLPGFVGGQYWQREESPLEGNCDHTSCLPSLWKGTLRWWTMLRFSPPQKCMSLHRYMRPLSSPPCQ